MTAPSSAGPERETVEAVRKILAAHFIMWREVSGDDTLGIRLPRGEWFCTCGAKFGFSDTAIDHAAAYVAAAVDEARAEAWDDAVQALAWSIDRSEGDHRDAMRYVATHNPHRAATEGER